jgi:hypothetical protein
MAGKPHRVDHRYYHIAGITIRLESDFPITDTTFDHKFKLFEVYEPGEDTITIRHHFSIPLLSSLDMAEEVYRRPPWAIYRKGPYWIYAVVSGGTGELIKRLWHSFSSRSHNKTEGDGTSHPRIAQERNIHQLAVINRRTVTIYNKTEKAFLRGNIPSLTLFPTDQILLAQLLAQRHGCYIHASGVVLDGKGILFVGHSEAGKSTMAMMLQDKAKILCDDRMIVRRWPESFKIHGTWSHGDVPTVAADTAPLKAILFLKQDRENRLIPLDHNQEIIGMILSCLIRSLGTEKWWGKTLALVETMAREVPCYTLHFTKDGGVIDLLRHL